MIIYPGIAVSHMINSLGNSHWYHGQSYGLYVKVQMANSLGITEGATANSHGNDGPTANDCLVVLLILSYT